MSIRQLFLASGVALAVAATTAHAQGAPAPVAAVTLTQALLAARNNIDVAIARGNVSAARADILSADHAPLPLLTGKLSSIDLQNGIGRGSPVDKRIDKSIGIDWTWERGNKRGLRTLAAQRSASAAEADVEDTQMQQLLATHAAYYDLLAAQERVQEITEVERSAAQLAGTADRRVRAGDLAAQEAARTQIEAQRARLDVQAAELDRTRASIALAQLMGLQGDAASPAAETSWPRADAAPQSAIDLAALVEARPDVRAAQTRVLAAQAQVDSAQAQRKTDVTWGASYDHYPSVSNKLIELRATIPLQWGYRYEGEIARALALQTQAQDALDKARRVATAELLRLQQEALNSARRLAGYDGDIVPRARKVADNAELAFNKGAMPLTDLLDARRTLRATLLEALDARADYARATGAWQLRTRPDTLLPAP